MCAATGSSRSDASTASRPRCPNIWRSSRHSKSAIPSLPRSARATTRSALPPMSRRMARDWFDQRDFPNPTIDPSSTADQEEQPMLNTATKAEAPADQALTDGFHLVIEALKLNGINTIYGVPGI